MYESSARMGSATDRCTLCALLAICMPVLKAGTVRLRHLRDELQSADTRVSWQLACATLHARCLDRPEQPALSMIPDAAIVLCSTRTALISLRTDCGLACARVASPVHTCARGNVLGVSDLAWSQTLKVYRGAPRKAVQSALSGPPY